MVVQTNYAKLFGAYDIRGIVGKNLDPDFAYKLGQASAQYISPNKTSRFLVGHDARSTSPKLAEALMKGLTDAGQNVDYMQIASTPHIYWQGAKGNYDCTTAITASHLPAQHNGFKICRKDAEPLSSENGLPEIFKLLDQAQLSKSTGTLTTLSENTLVDYVTMMAAFLHCSKSLKGIVDCGGSPMGPELEQLCKQIKNIELIGLGTTLDGTFSRRSANPLDEGALDELRQRVIEEKAQFGAAFDGDGDRIVVLDEKGEMIAPDLLTALIAERVLSTNSGAKIMYDLRSSRIVPEFIESLGGTAIKSRVGHSLIKADMRSQNVLFAGELSGHYYWADLFYTDNAMRVLIELANLLSAQTKPLSELIKPLKKYAESGEVNFKLENCQEIIKRLETQFADGKKYYVDGLSVEYPTWWFNVRTSKTEPVLRLCLGANTEAELKKRLNELSSAIKAA